MQFDGYTRVLAAAARRDEDRPIPAFAEGERLRLVDAGVAQHFTKPPARYGEASLVRELEKLGIGRPSTYAAIISTIQERGYVSLEKRRFSGRTHRGAGDRSSRRELRQPDGLLLHRRTRRRTGPDRWRRAWLARRAGRLLRGIQRPAREGRSGGRRDAGQRTDGHRRTLLPLRPPDAGPYGQHRRIPRLLRVSTAAEGALHEHPQPHAGGRGRGRRGGRRAGARRSGVAAVEAPLREVRDADGLLPDRCPAQAARVRQQIRTAGASR